MKAGVGVLIPPCVTVSRDASCCNPATSLTHAYKGLRGVPARETGVVGREIGVVGREWGWEMMAFWGGGC